MATLLAALLLPFIVINLSLYEAFADFGNATFYGGGDASGTMGMYIISIS